MEAKKFTQEFAYEENNNLVRQVDDYDEFPNKDLLDKLRSRIIQNIIDNDASNNNSMGEFIKEQIDRTIEGYDLTNEERSYIYNLIDNEINGFGPLTELLDDKSITEIMVNSPKEIYIEIDGQLIKDESVYLYVNQHYIRKQKLKRFCFVDLYQMILKDLFYE